MASESSSSVALDFQRDIRYPFGKVPPAKTVFFELIQLADRKEVTRLQAGKESFFSEYNRLVRELRENEERFRRLLITIRDLERYPDVTTHQYPLFELCGELCECREEAKKVKKAIDGFSSEYKERCLKKSAVSC